MTWRCPVCGAAIGRDQNFCKHRGLSVTVAPFVNTTLGPYASPDGAYGPEQGGVVIDTRAGAPRALV